MKKISEYICSLIMVLSLTAAGSSLLNQSFSEAKAASDLYDQLPMTVRIKDYGNDEKVVISEMNGRIKKKPIKTPTDFTEISDSESESMRMNVKVGNHKFKATLENNSAAKALLKMMKKAPVVIRMSDYSGFEKVGELSCELPASNSQMTAEAGDIVLYNGNQIVMFYGSNSWSYTKLGKIDDLTGWEEALGDGDVRVVLTAAP